MFFQELTSKLQAFLSAGLPGRRVIVHGVDVDRTLIERAEQGLASDDVKFHHVDIAKDGEALNEILEQHGAERFDLVSCFSVTMWIHLNHGDDGLGAFVKKVSDIATHVLLEPQPWKCYQTAARRMRKLCQPEFEHMKTLKHTGPELEKFILKLCSDNGLTVVNQFGETDWKRKLLLLKKE